MCDSLFPTCLVWHLMEEKASIKSAMVSRLPKFGGRSSGGGTSTLSNGCTQPSAPTQDGKSTPLGVRPNGVICATPFSLKWKKDEGTGTAPPSPTAAITPGDGGEDKAQTQAFSLAKDIKNGSPGTPKMRRSGALMLAVSSPKAIPKQSLKMSPKAGSTLGQSPLNGSLKVAQNASSIPAHAGSESRLVRPKFGSSSPRSSSQDSLSVSSDSLKTMEGENMVRSNSFTHFKQIPSPTSQPMIRSFSFNRAVELAKPLANTQLRPPRGTFLKPPQLSNGRIGLGLGNLNGNGGPGGLGGGLQCSKTPPAASSLPTLSIPSAPNTPSALKKPLLPSCVLTKSLGSTGGSFAYRVASSGQAKQQKPFFPGKAKDHRSLASPDCQGVLGIAKDIQSAVEVDKTDSRSESDGSSADGGGKEGGSHLLAQGSCLAAGETLEDMSLSSASSLDRGDFSEEFLDDCNAGNVLRDGDLPDCRDGSSKDQSLHSSLNETLDWDNMDLEGKKKKWIARIF